MRAARTIHNDGGVDSLFAVRKHSRYDACFCQTRASAKVGWDDKIMGTPSVGKSHVLTKLARPCLTVHGRSNVLMARRWSIAR
jgi:hypothetical protein